MTKRKTLAKQKTRANQKTKSIQSKFGHTPDYLLLFLGLGLGFAGFIFSWPQTSHQQLWVFYLALFYILWGIVHHARTDGWHARIIAEYVGVAILLTVALTFALQY